MNDMRPVTLENLLQTKERELQALPRCPRGGKDDAKFVRADEIWVESTSRAKAMLEAFVVQAFHQFQDAELRTAAAEIIHNVHYAQARPMG